MANFDITVDDRDVRRLTDKLGRLRKGLRTRIARKAVRAGAAPAVKAVRRKIPRDTGLLKRNITQSVKTYRSNAITISMVGARSLPDDEKSPSRYIHLVENDTQGHEIKGAFVINKGTAAERTIGNFTHPGTQGKRMVASAFAETKDLSRKLFRDKLEEEIDRALMGP